MRTAQIILLTVISALVSACSLESGAKIISQQQLISRLASGEAMLLLDVRTEGEYGEGYIGNAIHIDHREIDSRLAEIAAYKEKPVVVYCLTGIRAAMVEMTLIEAGFQQVFHLQGDWSAWKDAKHPISQRGESKAATASTHP